ncbi:MAG TPA: hypothetical protein VEK73_18380 [Xanthobacteraceae bacterium]|nr:hypothetical protein [Xanthobacteraceae bacterium]
MYWIKRRFAYAEYAPYMAILEKLLMANPTQYQEFLMVSTEVPDDPGEGDYYIGVPHKAFAMAFDGFTPVEESDLPKEIDSFLLGDQTKQPFTSRFKFRDRYSRR